jgi:quercetin dioxygenase-like cupin family protein
VTGSRPGATSTRARSPALASGSLGPFGGSERAWPWPPGGGPPPHIHRYEDETFYILEGECRILLADEWITAGVGDFINVPRGTVHRFHNQGTETIRMILTFTPAGIENFFQKTLQPTLDPTADIPDNLDAAAPGYGLQFVTE